MFNITTVEGQEQQYSALSRAKQARKLQETMGFVSERALLHMIDNNLIIGSKVWRRDVIIANDIYGANTNSLKGKTVRPLIQYKVLSPGILRTRGLLVNYYGTL